MNVQITAPLNVMALAREAGCPDPMVFRSSLERFAELVAADAESASLRAQLALVQFKEACLRAEHDAQRARGELAEAVAAEREACAALVESPLGIKLASINERQLAAAIRARGAA